MFEVVSITCAVEVTCGKFHIVTVTHYLYIKVMSDEESAFKLVVSYPVAFIFFF